MDLKLSVYFLIHIIPEQVFIINYKLVNIS